MVQIVEPHSPQAETGRPPFAIETKLRIHYLQQWFRLSARPWERRCTTCPLYREFAGLGDGASRLPDETTMRRLGFAESDSVDVHTAVDDGRVRSVRGLRVTPYDIPAGGAGG